MKKFARLLSMVLAVATVLTLCVGAFDYVDAADIDESKVDAVNAVYDWGIMQGNNKGEFNPKGLLTRDEMSKIMYAMKEIGLDVESYYGGFLTAAFVDAAKVPAWSKNYMGYAYIENIFVGNAKKEINALGNLSYVQATIVLLRALGADRMYGFDNNPEGVKITYVVDGKTYNLFEGPKWFENAVSYGAKYTLFKGLDITDFNANITREDVAVMIKNAVDYAVKHFGERFFSLSEKVEGVVIGTETKDKVDYFKFASSKELYPIGDLNVADFMGKKVEFYTEGEDEEKQIVSAIKSLDKGVVNTTVGAIDIDEKDDSIDEKDGYYRADEKNFAKIAEVKTAYLFKNNTMKGEPVQVQPDSTLAKELQRQLTSELKNGLGFEAITLINNGDSISVIYNPVVFIDGKFVKSIGGIKREHKDNKYTGKYYVTYNGNDLYVPMKKLDDNAWLAVRVNGNEVEVVGTPKTIDVADIDASVKGGNYTFTYKGEKMTVVTAKNAVLGDVTMLSGNADMFDKIAGKDAKTMNALVYGNLILGVSNKPTALELGTYAYVLDVTTTASAGNKIYVVKALVNAEIKEIIVKPSKKTGVNVEPVVGNVYDYSLLTEEKFGEDCEKEYGLKKGDVVLTNGTNVTLDKWNETDFDATKHSDKVVVVYNKDLDTVIDATKLIAKDGVVTLEGEEIFEGALHIYKGAKYILIWIQYK